MLIVLSGPSGAGKSTLVKALVSRDPRLHFSVSCTTRVPKMGEVHGSHYHFVTNDRFMEMVKDKELAEWAEVHGQLYGTLFKELARGLAGECDLILDIDCVGAFQIKEKYPKAKIIFILPPGFPELERRLRSRNRGDSESELFLRLTAAYQEVNNTSLFDHWVVNRELDTAVVEIEELIENFRFHREFKRDFRDKEALDQVKSTFPQPSI